MYFTTAASTALLLATANAAITTATASVASTSTSTVHLPLVTGMPLKASVINASGSNITYHVECDHNQSGTQRCNIPPVTITEIDQKTYKGEASKFGMDISIACTARPKNEMFCSNSIGGALASGIGILNSALGGGDKSATITPSATATSAGGLFGLPKTTTYPSSEVGNVVVAITAGVQKLASASGSSSASTTTTATQTTQTDASGSATTTVVSTGTNLGLPKATGNAELLAGGALAALALIL